MTNSVNILLVLAAVAGVCIAVPEHAATIRVPSFPLAVRVPHASIWLPHNELPGSWPAFWTGATKGWTGLVRVDGNTHIFMGKPLHANGSSIGTVAKQTGTYVTPTQTIFEITAGPLDLTVTFMSPVEYNDTRLQSIPLSYIFVEAKANDGASHNVQVYMDITGEWGSNDDSRVITWDIKQSPSNNLKIFSTQRQIQYKFAQDGDYPAWGSAVFITDAEATHASGSDIDVRTTFATRGLLGNTNDNNFRCVSCDWPTFGFAQDLGSVSGAAAKSVQFVVGHIREENINLRQVAQKALWTHYFESSAHMIEFFYGDVANALARSNALDVKLLNDAFETQGEAYATVIALSTRQAYGALEFSGNVTHPLLYLKEISSNGNMQTVDVMYPSIPIHYYLNIKNLEYLLEPLFYQMENPFWPKDYSIHDIGFNFPNATGHDDGNQEDMPVEESANMILMVGNIVFHPDANVAESKAYAEKHYPVMTKWADYLFRNCLYPENQLTTDDFIGHTELNSGLALKGILGLKAFAKISTLIGQTENAAFYNGIVESYIQTWILESTHADGTHLKMEYNVSNGYQFKYNAYQDKQLSLGAVPEEIYVKEAAYYLTKEEPYGIPFVSTHDYTKSDWEVWTAAAFGEANPTLRKNLIEALARFLRYSQSRVPFSDWYVTATANQAGFQCRPVVGGHFALLALNRPAAA